MAVAASVPGAIVKNVQSDVHDDAVLDEKDLEFYVDSAAPAILKHKVKFQGTTYTGGTSASATELDQLDGVTAGTVTASKAVVVGANKELDTLVIADGGLKLGSGAGTAVTSTAAELNILDGVLATAAEINRAADVSTRLVAAGATLSATVADHSDKVILLDTAAGSVVTLPDATGSGAVLRFAVSVLATSNSHVIQVPDADNIIQGAVEVVDTDTAGTVTGFATAADSDTITLNRSTTGSVTRGEWIELIDAAADLWLVRGVVTNTGSGATPFSAAVS